MALYINGRPVNPIVTFLVSVAVLAGIVGLGILLLPVIGGLFMVALIAIGGVALYGMYCRWRYGDPFERMQKQAEEMLHRRAQGHEQDAMHPQAREEAEFKSGEARTGIKRRTTIEDAVVVEEIRHKDI